MSRYSWISVPRQPSMSIDPSIISVVILSKGFVSNTYVEANTKLCTFEKRKGLYGKVQWHRDKSQHSNLPPPQRVVGIYLRQEAGKVVHIL